MRFTPGHVIFEPAKDLIGAGLIAIVALILIGGFVLAAEKTPLPKNKPAIFTPQGSIAFGETATMTPAQQRKFILKYPEMTQKEIDDLTAALKRRRDQPPVMIVCKDPMCEDLALNLDNAFESARYKSEIIIGTQFGVPPGVTVSSSWLADALNGATGNRYGASVPKEKPADGEFILIGSRPR